VGVDATAAKTSIIPAMSALVAKVVLAPAFVVGVSLAARRFGPRVGGLVGGLPVVAGPILLVFALEHGATFAAQAAAGTLLGMVSLSVFIVVYARAAAVRVSWFTSLLAGWAGFAAMTVLLDGMSVSAGVALTIVLVTLALTLAVLRQDMQEPDSRADPPAWDLPVRAASALALVLALTALAGHLGAHLSGLLAPFPVIASVLAVFTHILHGDEDVVRILRGFVVALVAYAMFCFTLAVSLRSLGIAGGFTTAIACALAIQALVLMLVWWRGRDRPGRGAHPQTAAERARDAA
jgi:hypothetical protein